MIVSADDDLFQFYVERIAEGLFDVFLSDDYGDTWLYYRSFDSESEARDEGQAALRYAEGLGDLEHLR